MNCSSQFCYSIKLIGDILTSQVPERRIIQTNCGKCSNLIRIDITDFEPNMTITNQYTCGNEHEYIISIRGGKIISIAPYLGIESDIDEYIDVPNHIKNLTKEAYRCSAYDIPVGGACIIRRLLDELLYELGFKQKYVGTKVKKFEEKCNNDASFKRQNETIFRRLHSFKTIANLAGFHAHAHQRPIVNVVKSEFEEYLHVVEAAIKDKWPNRGNP